MKFVLDVRFVVLKGVYLSTVLFLCLTFVSLVRKGRSFKYGLISLSASVFDKKGSSMAVRFCSSVVFYV